MRRSRSLVLLAVVCLPVSSALAQRSIDNTLVPYLDKYHLPALAAAVVQDGVVVAAGAVGTRKLGEKIPVTLNDRFHIGSDTKAMTATLAAMFVEEGKLRWDSNIGEIFSDLSEGMDEGLRGVTLSQLLSHSSGIPSDNPTFMGILMRARLQPGNLDEQRHWLINKWKTQKLVAKPGSTFAYANLNYIIAGAMIEKVAKKSWEELIVERLFIPLDLKTAGLGHQSSLGRIDAPLGHLSVGEKTRSFMAGPNADNPPVLGPAGIAHMSVLDFARWAGWNAGRGKRGPRLIKPETMMKLQTPLVSIPAPKDEANSENKNSEQKAGYAFGWGVVPVAGAKKPLLSHAGSNTMNLAQITIDPEKDLAIVLMTNIGGESAEKAFHSLQSELYKEFSSN